MTLAGSVSAITTVAHATKPPPSGINLWAAIVAAGVIIGIIAGIIGVVAYIQVLKQRRVDREIIEIAKSNVDAKGTEKSKKEAEEELKHLKGLRDDLSLQISQLPEEANKLFLERQLEELAMNISRDFAEYENIGARLQAAAAASTLDPRIREIIRNSILPVQKERERRNSYMLLLLILLLALNLSPIHISEYIWQYFSVLSNSLSWTPSTPPWAILFGSIAIAALLWCAYSLIPRLQKYTTKLPLMILIVASAALLAIAIGLGYDFRDDAGGSPSCGGFYCSYPSIPYIMAGIAFNLAPIFGGLFLFFVVRLRPRLMAVLTRLRAAR